LSGSKGAASLIPASQKGIFTAEEISKLLKKANPDWRGAILVGYFTGARLKDVCNQRWGNVDWRSGLLLSGPERLVNSSQSQFILN